MKIEFRASDKNEILASFYLLFSLNYNTIFYYNLKYVYESHILQKRTKLNN